MHCVPAVRAHARVGVFAASILAHGVAHDGAVLGLVGQVALLLLLRAVLAVAAGLAVAAVLAVAAAALALPCEREKIVSK
jgi:hypothetical protein